METLHLRMLLANQALLKCFLSGKIPDFDEDIRAQIIIAERRRNPGKPDQFLEFSLEKNLQNIKNIQELLGVGLPRLASAFLEENGDSLAVRLMRLEAWQALITHVSPLVLLAGKLHLVHEPPVYALHDRRLMLDYFDRHIYPQVGASALPTARVPLVEDMISREGLADVHVHLSGSTEVDAVWQNALNNPDEYMRYIASAYENVKKRRVRELYLQVEQGLTPRKVYFRLRLARSLRTALVEHMLEQGDERHSWCKHLQKSLRPGYRAWHFQFDAEHTLTSHPLRKLYGFAPNVSDICCELLWLALTFQYLNTHSDEQFFSQALYVYLLIQNATFLPLCVMQVEQFGFTQFQKFTENDVRMQAERSYQARFRQAANSVDPGQSDLWLLEGRFSPSDTIAKTADLLGNIIAGFAAFQGAPGGVGILDQSPGYPHKRMNRLDLRLVAHFIKTDELEQVSVSKKASLQICRFNHLRQSVRTRAHALVALRERHPILQHYVQGMDAAANELHSPPEVFAPTFRYLRRHGLRWATYHAGEDFPHLISGIRAIWEAVNFLELRAGDRLGHCTAIGIDPALWVERALADCGSLALRQGDWLDDLVFAYRQLLDVPEALPYLNTLSDAIHTLFQKVYAGLSFAGTTVNLMWAAYQLRPRDVLLAFEPDLETRFILDEENMQERMRIIKYKSDPAGQEAWRLFEHYHSHDILPAWRRADVVDAKILPVSCLKILQDKMIDLLNQRQIAIETLPTSNVRISYYDNYSEHHLLRWLGLKGAGPVPTVCVGSDDPGIFSASLRNEFVHIYLMLLKAGLTPDQAVGRLEMLNRNGRLHAFTSTTGTGLSQAMP